MNSRFLSWLRRRKRSAEPGAAMFAGLRSRLTIWYCGVLAAALILFGIALYIGVQQMLLSPIHSDVEDRVTHLQQEWEAFPNLACASTGLGVRFVPAFGIGPGSGTLRLPRGAPPNSRGSDQIFSACFDPNGHLVDAGASAALPSPLLNSLLAGDAIRNGAASDTVDAGNGIGQTYRYALVARDPAGGVLGVVMAAESVQAQTDALHVVLELLLILGALTLLGAGAGGLFLSGRALVPARLAFARQQAFVADASHEFRTPLALLRADADVLLRGRDRLAPDQAALVGEIVTETSHMAALATTLLNQARLDSGQLRLERDVVDLTDMVNGVAGRVEALAQETGIETRAETGPPILVIGDRTLLEQVLLTILDNAIKYNRAHGTITVRTSQSDGRAIVEVADTGIGIAPEHLRHLGERFYRVDKARTRASGVAGVGLGLSMARGIVSAHEGTLTFTSRPGEGTTVTILLPTARIGAAGHPLGAQQTP